MNDLRAEPIVAQIGIRPVGRLRQCGSGFLTPSNLMRIVCAQTLLVAITAAK